jgi:methylenetetrahydrofolate reductase (NADPH)
MKDPIVSFEFFPPNDAAMAELLWQSVQRLAPLQPRFVSVTYGADGSTRTRTHECVLRIQRETNLRVAPHLTCVAASREEVLAIAQDYWKQGIRHLVALRGDAPASHKSAEGLYTPHPGGFGFASDLVGGLKQIGDFELSVAAFPEGHPECGSIDADLENLKRKIDAGANRAITQFFFDTDLFLRYRDRCAAAGIPASIVPGILPITRFPQMVRVAARCGASVPQWLHQRVRRPGRRSGHAPHDCRQRGHRAGAAAA